MEAINVKIDGSLIDIANSVIDHHKYEFKSIRVSKDPRHMNVNKWLTTDEVEKIHTNIIHAIGGSSGIHSKQELEYRLMKPLTDVVGIERKTILERICECTFDIGRCFVDCGPQTAATIFITLCKINDVDISFKLGEIYDIFPKLGNEIDYEKFKYLIYSKITSKKVDENIK